MNRRVALWVLASVLMVLSGACSDSESATDTTASSDEVVSEPVTPVSPSEAGPETQGATPNPGASAPAAEAMTDSVPDSPETVSVSPIDLALGSITDVDELKLTLDNAVVVHAEILTTCMRERGWDAFTFEPIVAYSEGDFLGNPYRRSAEELRQFGYGAVFNAATSLEQLEQRIAFEANPPALPPQPGQRQSESEQQAQHADEAYCYDYAAENAPQLPNQLAAPVQQTVSDFRSSVMESEAVQEVWSEWSECMAQSGFSYADRTAIALDFQQSVSPIITGLQATSSDTPDEKLNDLDRLLTEVENREATVVEADIECAQAAQLDTRITQILFDAETVFVEANGDQLIAANS